MTKRQALLAIFAIPMGAFDGFQPRAAEAASLRIPLDQWSSVTIECGGKTLSFTARQLFAALQEPKS